MEEKRGRLFRNMYKGHMDKTKGEGGEGGGRWVHLGWGRGMGRKDLLPWKFPCNSAPC